MSEQITKQINQRKSTRSNCVNKMADIFVTYLTEMIDDDGLKKLREDEEFSALTQYIPEMGITVFPALVEVSKKYLSLSLQEILLDFSEYYQNYELIEC